jgi:hypothetical protein
MSTDPGRRSGPGQQRTAIVTALLVMVLLG